MRWRLALVAIGLAAGTARADDAEGLARLARMDAISCADTLAGLDEGAEVASDRRLAKERVELARLCKSLDNDVRDLRAVADQMRTCTDCGAAEHLLRIDAKLAAADGLAAARVAADAWLRYARIASVAADPDDGAASAAKTGVATARPSAASPSRATTASPDPQRDCELGDAEACAKVAGALAPDQLVAWRTRACERHGVADACFALADADAAADAAASPRFAARGARLLDRRCRGRRDAAACHQLATLYSTGGIGVAASPERAKRYERLTLRFVPR